MSDELAKPDSVMDDLRTVADSLASNEPIEPAAPTTEAAPTSTPKPDSSPDEPKPVAKSGRDEHGRFAQKPKGPAAPAQNGDLTAKTPPAHNQHIAPTNGAVPRETPAIAPATPPAETLKAPPNWKPAAREKWAALPAEVQQEAIRVDREVRQVMQETAEFRKHHQAFQAAVGPFEGMIRAEGGEPMQAIGSLLQTAAALRTAPAHHKAQIVAQIVKTYGVDVAALDAALVGEAPPPGQPGQQGAYQDPRVDQLLAQINQAKQAQAQSVSQRTAQTIQDFAAKSEFFEDLREEMGDIMRVRGERGIAMSLEDAYNHALKLHPEISGIVEQRAAAEKARNANASTQRVRNAASSVKSQPAGGSPPRNESGGTVMDDVREAWAQLNNR